MKSLLKVIIVTISVFCCKLSNAAVLTVCNYGTVAQFTSLANAYVAANPGDTLYVYGSPTDYGTFIVQKKITIIGAGYADSSINLSTTISTIVLDTTVSSTASGSNIIGINFTNINFTANSVTNVFISRCNNFSTGGFIAMGPVNWTIENCVLDNIVFSLFGGSFVGCSSGIVNNNVIEGFPGDSYGSGYASAPGLLFDHNMVVGNTGGPGGALSYFIGTYATITNNVFLNFSSVGSAGYSNFTNNLLVYTAGPVSYPIGSYDIGSGNLDTTSSPFVNGLIYWTNPSSLSSNWQLLPSCSGHNGATDGTDIGIFGGSSPMMNFTGAAAIPQMTLLTAPTTVTLDSPINVHFKARQQH